MLLEGDLNVIKGLLHYLNQNVNPTSTPASPLAAEDFWLVDCNGERLGRITYENNRYGLDVGGR